MSLEIPYKSDIDLILSAFYQITENSKLEEKEVIETLSSLLDDFSILPSKLLLKCYDEKIKPFPRGSIEYLKLNLKRIIVKRIMFFAINEQIVATKTNLEFFLDLLKKYGLANLTEI